MTILQVGILALLAVMIGFLPRARIWLLLAISSFVVFWLQPRFNTAVIATYWLPTATFFVVVVSWTLTSSSNMRSWRLNLPALLILLGVMVLFSLNRYLKLNFFFETVTPNPVVAIGAWIVLLLLVVFLIRSKYRSFFLVAFPFVLLGLILLTKSTYLGGWLYTAGERLLGMDVDFETYQLHWLGFSYVAFRLIHTFIDKRAGRLPEASLAEYVIYVIFFPAFSAGPIDRIERFIQDLRHPKPLDRQGWLEAVERFLLGLFKKFVLADTLALLSLSAIGSLVISPYRVWLLVYIYAFRILLDFSGYTDIAIGTGLMMGVRLPENFASPYLKSNLIQFWNSWHMSLTQWFRNYFFNPLLRAIRNSNFRLPEAGVIFVCQTATMVLIGLWHGITWNFVLWGLWHALGLFLNNRWNVLTRTRIEAWKTTTFRTTAVSILGIFITFNFVSLGWVLFASRTPMEAWIIFKQLFFIS